MRTLLILLLLAAPVAAQEEEIVEEGTWRMIESPDNLIPHPAASARPPYISIEGDDNVLIPITARPIRDSIEPAVIAQVGFDPASGELSEVEQLRQDVDRHTVLMIQGGAMGIGIAFDMGTTEVCISEFPTKCAEATDDPLDWMQSSGTGRMAMQLLGGAVMVGANSLFIRWDQEWASWVNTGAFTLYKFYLAKHNTDVLNDLRALYPGGDPGRQEAKVTISGPVGLVFDGNSIGIGVSW
ncbi:MAG TPA: hypothetical protein VMZ50_05365 [Phycisphaerae bacterium]|nr:hypothetical protein [Phycisphaerae bacterium]